MSEPTNNTPSDEDKVRYTFTYKVTVKTQKVPTLADIRGLQADLMSDAYVALEDYLHKLEDENSILNSNGNLLLFAVSQLREWFEEAHSVMQTQSTAISTIIEQKGVTEPTRTALEKIAEWLALQAEKIRAMLEAQLWTKIAELNSSDESDETS